MVECNKQLIDIDQAIDIIKSSLSRMEAVYQQLSEGRDRFIEEHKAIKTKRGDYITVDEVRIQLLNDIAETSKKLTQMIDIRVNNEKKAEELAFIRRVLGKMSSGAELEVCDKKFKIDEIESMIEKDKLSYAEDQEE